MNRQFSQRWHRCVQASAAVDQLFVSRLLSVEAPFSSLAQSRCGSINGVKKLHSTAETVCCLRITPQLNLYLYRPHGSNLACS